MLVEYSLPGTAFVKPRIRVDLRELEKSVLSTRDTTAVQLKEVCFALVNFEDNRPRI